MSMGTREEILRRIEEDPALLGSGLRWLRGPLPLRSDLQVDALLQVAEDQAVLLLVEDSARGSLADLAGRLVLVHGELRASRALVEALLEERGLRLSHLLLVMPRAPDALLATAALLQDPEVRVDSVGQHWMGSQPPRDRAGEQDRGEDPVALVPVADEGTEGAVETGSKRTIRAVAEPPQALLEEARRRILRISDDVEAEVDGNLTRYCVHRRLLAVLEEEERGRFHLHVGTPPRKRMIGTSRELGLALDEILDQYLTAEEGAGERRAS